MTIIHSKQRKIKAHLVSIGDREDGYQKFVTPGRKGVLEFNWWVLKEKLKLGFALSLIVVLSAIISTLGWQSVLAVAITLFLIGFFKGGDIETGP